MRDLRIELREYGGRSRRINGAVLGFTLVELVIVVLMIAILSVVAASKIQTALFDAKISGTTSQLDAFADAVELYRAKNGTYPPTTTVANADSTLGPYLHPSFFKRRLAIGTGQYSQYSKPYWYYYNSGTYEYGYLLLPYVDPEVAIEVDAMADDGIKTTGDIWSYDLRSSGHDFGHILLWVVKEI